MNLALISLEDTGFQSIKLLDAFFERSRPTPSWCFFSSPKYKSLCPACSTMPCLVLRTSERPMTSHLNYLLRWSTSKSRLPSFQSVLTFHVPIDAMCLASISLSTFLFLPYNQFFEVGPRVALDLWRGPPSWHFSVFIRLLMVVSCGLFHKAVPHSSPH